MVPHTVAPWNSDSRNCWRVSEEGLAAQLVDRMGVFRMEVVLEAPDLDASRQAALEVRVVGCNFFVGVDERILVACGYVLPFLSLLCLYA